MLDLQITPDKQGSRPMVGRTYIVCDTRKRFVEHNEKLRLVRRALTDEFKEHELALSSG